MEYLGEKMLEIGLMIKESICEEIQSSNAEMKSKITDATKSYANVAKNRVVQSNSDLKTIIHEARHAEMTEQRDRNSRTCNIIIHSEDQADDGEAEKKYVATLFENIKVPVNIKWIARIGIWADFNKRPIKVSLANEKEKKPCLEKSCSLKNNTVYVGISITEDLTVVERAYLKEWVDKAKSLNQSLPAESTSIWRVRGDSKNGYRLKEFTKSQ